MWPRPQNSSASGQSKVAAPASQDADALSQALHLVVLRLEDPTEVHIREQRGPGQRMLRYELLPAGVVALVRYVPLAHLPLQFPEVQPRLVLLGASQ